MIGTKKTRQSLGVVALLVSLGLSADVDAAFQYTTSVTGVSYSGSGGLTSGTLAANTTYTVNGISILTGAQGGSTFTDTAGTTLYFVEGSRTAGSQAVANEQIYVINSTSGAVDSGTFSFSTIIGVSNNGVTSSFNEGPSTLVMDLIGQNSNYVINTSGVTPGSQNIGGTIFTASNAQATSGDINSSQNGAVSAVISATSAVPEPASMALFGMGAVGLFGAMIRQRRKA